MARAGIPEAEREGVIQAAIADADSLIAGLLQAGMR